MQLSAVQDAAPFDTTLMPPGEGASACPRGEIGSSMSDADVDYESVDLLGQTSTRRQLPVNVTTSMMHDSQNDSSSSQNQSEWNLFYEMLSNGDTHRPRIGSVYSDSRPPMSLSSKSEETHNEPLNDTNGSTFTFNNVSFSAEPEQVDDNLGRDNDIYNDADDNSSPSLASPLIKRGYLVWRQLSVMEKNVIKCVMAYFFASLFTYVPKLSGFLSDITSEGDSPSPSGHMVATVTVYFNPAKTLGSMLEADMFCLAGVFYSAAVSLTSMSLYWFLETRSGWDWLADTLAIGLLSVSMSGIAWTKLWMGKPSFSTACSMMAIIIFVVVVKEGGFETLMQVSIIIFLGAAVSNLVSFVMWPQYAAVRLRNDLVKSLESYSTLLHMLTRTFLLDAETYHSRQKLDRAVNAHQSSFTSLRTDLDESKSEWRLSGHTTVSYDDAVDCMQRIAQHLGGLRSGTTLQADIIKVYQTPHSTVTSWSDVNGSGGASTRLFRAAIQAFGEMINDLGPPVEALSLACTRSFDGMARLLNTNVADINNSSEFGLLAAKLRKAIFLFESTSNQAILRVYRRDDPFDPSGENPTIGPQEKEEALFVMYFFMFTLQQLAEETLVLIESTRYICAFENTAKPNRLRWVFGRAYKWIKSTFTRTEMRRPKTLRSFSDFAKLEMTKRNNRIFPNIRPHAPNTVQTPAMSSLSYWGRIKQMIWRIQSSLRAPDRVFAFKAGLAVAILASPAFFQSTRPIFIEYRGEWALISFFVVMSPTIGATNYLSLHRIGGTLLGACTALAIYSAFPHNAFALSLFGAIFSAPCFWLILSKPQYATTGRFILLTYNLTCLYSYNMREEGTSVIDIARHRVVAVAVGVTWALVVSRFLWPSLARREFSNLLSELCLHLGWFYTKLVSAYSKPPEVLSGDSTRLGVAAILPQQADHELFKLVSDFQSMELHLQRHLLRLQELLVQATHEPRLKGPFPVSLYRSVLLYLQSVLDRLHSMRCVTTRADWFTSVRHDLIMPVYEERREMVGNVLLYFSTLASAFRLKAPLPPYLPPAEQSRRRLVRAIRNLPIVTEHKVESSRQLLYFAYALTMRGVIKDLDTLGRILQEAFGVIGQTTSDFERMFDAGTSFTA